MMSPEERQAVQARAETATPGPWITYSVKPVTDEPQVHGVEIAEFADTGTETAIFEDQWCQKPDREFIAAARTAVPALLADIAELERRIGKALALHWSRGGYCNECGVGFTFPCDTVRALTEEEK